MFRRLFKSKSKKKEELRDRLQQAVANSKVKTTAKGLVIAMLLTASMETMSVQAGEINKVTRNDGTTYDCTCGHLSWMGIVADPCQKKEVSLSSFLYGEDYAQATKQTSKEPRQGLFVKLFNTILSIFK